MEGVERRTKASLPQGFRCLLIFHFLDATLHCFHAAVGRRRVHRLRFPDGRFRRRLTDLVGSLRLRRARVLLMIALRLQRIIQRR